MNKILCSRKICFDAAHRVLNHESKCANLHGHRYKLIAYAQAEQLDSIGRVIDFSVIKEKLGGWIDQYWDHTTILNINDEKLIKACNEHGMKDKKVFVCDFNPTAENMADYLINEICPQIFLGDEIAISKIELYETDNCKAEVTLG